MRAAALLLLVGCNADPGPNPQNVIYRTGSPDSGERGTIKISEVMWSGSVNDAGAWDPADVFVELRNESNRPVNLSGWRLVLTGPRTQTWVIPDSDLEITVGAHVFLAAKDTGCFPEPDWVVPDMSFSYGDPFELTLLDRDDRLLESAGAEDAPPFAGGYDGFQSRSMERAELMFGADGTFPHVWHFYTDAEVEVPNDDRVAEGCRASTLASPGRPNSPDYSGALATGSFE